jgi:hypothetical protein
VSASCSFEFRGSDELQNPAKMEGKVMRMRLDCHGADVIGQLQFRIYLFYLQYIPSDIESGLCWADGG